MAYIQQRQLHANFVNARGHLLHLLKQHEVDCLLINSAVNRFWLLGIESSFGFCFLLKDGSVHLFVDARYYESLKVVLKATATVHLFSNYQQLAKWLESHQLKKVLAEDLYTNIVTWRIYQQLFSEIQFFDAVKIRIIKHPSELALLQKAADIAVQALKQGLLAIKFGQTTEKELARILSINMLLLGASKNAFEPIVASGVNGANPHHCSSDKLIQQDECLTVDLGCVYEGYCSDMTRSFFFGSTALNPLLAAAYANLLAANEQGIAAVKVGVNSSEVDLACRRVLQAADLNQFFTHSTGHGVGIEVHELPNVSTNSCQTLAKNMVLTVEPGVYIPGVGGLRIEDTVVVTETAALVLTKGFPKANLVCNLESL